MLKRTTTTAIVAAAIAVGAGYTLYAGVDCSTRNTEIRSVLHAHVWVPERYQVCDGWRRLATTAGVR